MTTNARKVVKNGVPEHSPEFIPAKSDVISSAVLARVFDDTPIPFQLNEDGSVNKEVYLTWIREVHRSALADNESMSATNAPRERTGVAGR